MFFLNILICFNSFIFYNFDFAFLGVLAEKASVFDISTEMFTKGLTFLYFDTAFIIFFLIILISLKRHDHTRSHDITSNAMRSPLRMKMKIRMKKSELTSLSHLIPPAVNHC